jgi:hypothetical protein
VRTEFTHQDPGPSSRAYNDPTLSATEFLAAVMHATHQPIAVRIQAASALLPYTHPYPRPTNSVPPRCTIVIPPFEPRTPEHEAHEGDNRKSQSFSEIANNNPHPQSGDPGPSNMMRDPEPSYLPDYSAPPDPAVFEAALKYGYPEPHLCSYCGHWLTVTYPDCICASRDPSKMN